MSEGDDNTFIEELANSITHGVGLALSVAGFVVLLVLSIMQGSAWHIVGCSIFGLTLVLAYLASTLYHSLHRSSFRRVLQILDHSAIYLLIAGTYTPVALISLGGAWRTTVLATVWVGAAAATLSKFCWVRAPKWLSVVIGTALGWVGVVALPQLVQREGIAPVSLLVAGGIAYTAGAVVYARRKPDPLPRVFGYHELFHALTIVALACQYVAIAFFVVRVD